MALPGNLGELSLSTLGEAIAFAAGFAAARAMEPIGVQLAQDAWKLAPVKAVDTGTAASIVAEDVELLHWGEGEAVQHGIDTDRFAAILGEALNAPGAAELLTMLRRGTIQVDDFAHGLRKAKLEARWDEPLEELRAARLDPAIIAAAIVRGLIADPGILPVGPPGAEGKVPRFPTFDVDALTEAAAAGIDRARLSVMVGNYGRPASPQQAAAAEWRGVIEHVDYQRAISEGDVRNEWAEAIFEASRAILTPHEYQEAALRGIIPQDEADRGSGKHGMVADDARLLFEIMGRPLPVHAITTGLARGATLGGTYDDVPEPYRDAIRRSNIRPEYARLAYANRYTYPGAFVLRTLAQAGDLTPADVEQTLLEIGWKPEFAAKITAAWTGSTAGKGDTHVTKAQTQLWNAVHKSYVDDLTTEAQARAALAELGVAADSQAAVLALWNHEREIVRSSLTPVQIKKALGQPGRDQAWALERLARLGYTAADAETFLAE